MTETRLAHRPADLAVAERQLAMSGELAQIAMELSRANGASALAAAHAVEIILADEYWQPETRSDRALAGRKDGAAAVRDLRAGTSTNSGVSPDWEHWITGEPELKYRPLQPRPSGWSECRPPNVEEYVAAPLLESVTPPQTPP